MIKGNLIFPRSWRCFRTISFINSASVIPFSSDIIIIFIIINAIYILWKHIISYGITNLDRSTYLCQSKTIVKFSEIPGITSDKKIIYCLYWSKRCYIPARASKFWGSASLIIGNKNSVPVCISNSCN